MRSILFLVASALVANAYITDIFERRKCLEAGAVCKTNGGVVGPCCKNAYCPEPIVDISRCTLNTVDAEDEYDDGYGKKCLKPGALCAGIAGPTGKCCKGSKCVYQSPDNAICEKTSKVTIEIDLGDVSTSQKCLKAGSLCEGIAGPTGTCCAGLRCVNESPDRSVCKKPASQYALDNLFANAKCLPSGATCSGIAGPTGKCCAGLRCVNESPDLSVCRGPKKSELVVQDNNSGFTQDKCLAAGSVCAKFSGPTGTCCPPFKCVYDFADTATCRGIKKLDDEIDADGDGACIKNGATCASATGRFQPCCAGWECVRDNPYDPAHGACYKRQKQ